MAGFLSKDRFDAPMRTAFVIAVFVIGTLGTLITPALFAAWARLRWTPAELGAVAATELASLAAGSLSGLYWQRRWNWRRVSFVALCLGVVGNLACLHLTGLVEVCIARGTAGLAGGLLCAVYSAFVANARAPGRIIAVTTFIQIGVEATFMFTTTSVFAILGSDGIFSLMAGFFAVLVPLLRYLPAAWPSTAPGTDEVSVPAHHPSWRGYPLLLSFVPFIVVQTGVYTFLGEFGRQAAHLDVAQTLHAIGVSVVLSALGSVAAYWLSDRIGLLVPIATSILVMAVTMGATVLMSRSALLFLLYISALQIAWIFLNCYLYSALIEANNLLVAAATTLSSFGSALGASAMGYALGHSGLAGSLVFSECAIGLTALLTIPFLKSVPSPRVALSDSSGGERPHRAGAP